MKLWTRVRDGVHFARHLPPPGMLALLYIGLVAIGALLLKLPFANTGGVGWGDALFTSTSAVTVTGLVVVDPGSAFTWFGQGVIALLIQLGGLGLMTFAVLLLSALGVSIGMPHRIILQEDLNQTSFSNIMSLMRVIMKVALLCELAGAALLAFVFVPEFGWAEGLWHAVFHTISAFNNAGFALFPDSLSRWAASPMVNIVVPALFIVGGLGFVVLGDLVKHRSWLRLTLHSKLMLAGTAALVLWAWITFAALEWSNPGTLGGLDGIGPKLAASWFQAVTPRTAGFNTIDTAGMHDATSLMTISLMLIGGGSTSTAGGIKVTTFIVLLLATYAFFRRRATLNAFGRSLGVSEVMKVMALTTVSLLLVMVGTFVMVVSHDGAFLPLAFEVASAFGTVGLSLGVTGDLSGFGRGLIIAVMLIGRVGPLAIGFFLATRTTPRVRYPGGQVYLG